ncbi:MAG: Lipid A biosynthesis palmitoleoyltransferase [Opitutia bacterium UBA7350]|nr:MAG: Lipid A biosynthesis palmitoleoyltransferase [Opitutae bacterium UBA7350]
MIRNLTNERRYRGFSKYLQYLLARGLISVLQWVPLPVAYRLGQAFGWLFWKLDLRRREVVRANLEVINDSLSEAERSKLTIDQQVRSVFVRNGANLISGFRLLSMPVERQLRHIKFEGMELLKQTLKEGKGAIFLLAHMGPWECTSAMMPILERHGIKAQIGAIYRPFNNDYLEIWYRKFRQRKGMRMISRRDGFHKAVGHLRSGGLLAILGDQKMREGQESTFFGRQVKANPLPSVFHRSNGAPIIGVSFYQVGAYQWIFSLRPCLGVDECRKQTRVFIAEICNQSIETSMKKSILDGFWLTPRF